MARQLSTKSALVAGCTERCRLLARRVSCRLPRRERAAAAASVSGAGGGVACSDALKCV